MVQLWFSSSLAPTSEKPFTSRRGPTRRKNRPAGLSNVDCNQRADTTTTLSERRLCVQRRLAWRILMFPLDFYSAAKPAPHYRRGQSFAARLPVVRTVRPTTLDRPKWGYTSSPQSNLKAEPFNLILNRSNY